MNRHNYASAQHIPSKDKIFPTLTTSMPCEVVECAASTNGSRKFAIGSNTETYNAIILEKKRDRRFVDRTKSQF